MPHVLLVDDDQSFTPALSDYIQQQCFTVSTAHNLEEARASLAQTHPDLLLVDLALPDGSGLDLLEDLQNRRTRVGRVNRLSQPRYGRAWLTGERGRLSRQAD